MTTNPTELNPETGRPYRLRSLRKRLAAAARARSEATLARQLEGADVRKAAARKARAADRAAGGRGVDRVPAHLRDLRPHVMTVEPDTKRTERDRALRGKDRIRARRAARRAES